jgi:hypothetical protein
MGELGAAVGEDPTSLPLMPAPLLYIPRFMRHYRNRRELGQSIGQALKSARVRMHSYR